MSPSLRLTIALGAMIGLMVTTHAVAQDVARDPTVAPNSTGVTPGSAVSPAGVEGMTVFVRDGKPYLMVGARLYAPGDQVGNLRVQRITEKEVWFHDGSALIKVQRFAGIERNVVATRPLCTVQGTDASTTAGGGPHASARTKTARAHVRRPSPASATRSRPAVAPCEDAQQ